jgi:uncharacterized protein (TIGR02271 family)
VTQTVIASFDSVAEAEQAARHLALDVGGVLGEVYDTRRAGILSALRMPGEETAIVTEAIRRGGAIVHATVPDEKHETVARVLERDGAYDIDEPVQAWRREDWGGWSGTAAPTGSTATTATSGTAAARGTETTARQGEERIPVAEERVNISKQATQQGRVRVRSYVVETPVQERVTLREERVEVERRPVDRPVAAGDDAFRGRVVEATETAEEAVVARRRVTEEVVVRREAGERTETVRDTVRRTEVEVEDEKGRTGAPERRDRT